MTCHAAHLSAAICPAATRLATLHLEAVLSSSLGRGRLRSTAGLARPVSLVAPLPPMLAAGGVRGL
ncbi:hypothetical protein [Pseudooceanicola nanhaiensis]|uniref:hypothetical protein n=1 Tax=Pseudooceanicola nanhaiensis TaxID=375761 RepID=UPI001CD5A0CE|nr:hypothetical protein [Pseudooceanicola nanhaiensis]MCA0920182.1 hypothetical protein [Pseudooceanicola nanhaiensis]